MCEAEGIDHTCEAYCDANLATCGEASGDYWVWGDKPRCLQVCAMWEAGTEGDTSGHTLACRISHTITARTDAATHCAHTGMYGGNTCGTWCEVYCFHALANCTDDMAIFADNDACMTACAEIPVGEKLYLPPDKNTIQCRIGKAISAPDMAAHAEYCKYASPESTECVDD